MFMFVAASGHRLLHVPCLSYEIFATLQVCPLEGCGIQLRVQGFSHKLPLLTRYITHQLATLTAEVGAFTLIAHQPSMTAQVYSGTFSAVR